MNILIVTTEFLNQEQNGLLDGGIANEYYKFAKGLVDLAHNVTILKVSPIFKPKNIDMNLDGIHVIEDSLDKKISLLDEFHYILDSISLKRPFQYRKRYHFFKHLKKKIMQINKENPIDIIQFTSQDRLSLCEIDEIPFCVRIASYYKNIAPEYGYIADKIYINEEKYMYFKSKFTFGPSKYIANLIKSELKLKQNIDIIETPFALSTSVIDNAYYNQIGDKKYILFFGTLGMLKGIFDLAKIIYPILNKYKDINFVFVGKQDLYNGILPINKIKENAKEYSNRIIYFDKIQHKYLYPIIQNAYCCLMPSRTENFSNTCLEAMGFGKIVIGTTPFFNQIITDGYNGFLCEAKNPKSIYEAIEKVLNLTKDEKEEIEKNAYNRIEQCSLTAKTYELVNYYNQVIKNWENIEIEEYIGNDNIIDRVKALMKTYCTPLLQKIFSVKNAEDKKHKIIILLGIKIKFRRAKKFKVSVLMPIYNTKEEYLREAIESILNQTFTNFEFIILNDSPDNIYLDKIINSYNDDRIIYVKNETNLGITKSRNKLLKLAKGEYIAVCDHDDISLAQRFQKEVDYLNKHKKVGLVSSNFVWLEENNTYTTDYPINNKDIKKHLAKWNCLLHTGMMFRKSVLDKWKIQYEEEYSPAEDYMLCTRLIKYTDFHNIPDVLVKYRATPDNTSHKNFEKMTKAANKIRNFCKKTYPYLYKEQHNSFIENIFSIKNSYNKKHKVITICGIKLKIKSNIYGQ